MVGSPQRKSAWAEGSCSSPAASQGTDGFVRYSGSSPDRVSGRCRRVGSDVAGVEHLGQSFGLGRLAVSWLVAFTLIQARL